MHVTTIGLDLAKTVFRVHGITSEGNIAFNRALRRGQVLAFFEQLAPCLVGIEACGTSHYWARELSRLAALYSTHSYGKTESAPLRDAIIKFHNAKYPDDQIQSDVEESHVLQ